LTRIAIVDYGLGNLFSVERAFTAAGATATITSDPQDLVAVDGIVLPGVGAFGEGMRNLEDRGFASAIRSLAAEGMPTLGICLGMQLLMEESEELGRWEGLALLSGRVIRFQPGETWVKVPQIGWNAIVPATTDRSWHGTLLDGIDPGEFVYFVHSYCVMAERPQDELARTEYAGLAFCSVVSHGNVMGCQFHPEKSGPAGLRLIHNFLASIPS
jgi:glutamine amidotransferase